MSESQENIEAKLSAFIEGDLDAAGRAEIEQHLAANPSHRKLLEELRRTRDFVRGLPRASAPPELVETLQGQLERSSLLDGIGEEERALQISSSRWPQIVSVAAVALLAVGLATVVYVALPSGTERPAVTQKTGDGAAGGRLAATTAASRPTTTVSTITVDALAGRADRAAEAKERAVVTAVDSTATATKPVTHRVAEALAGAADATRDDKPGATAIADATGDAAAPAVPPAAVPPSAAVAATPAPAKPSETDIEALAFADGHTAIPADTTRGAAVEKLATDVGPIAAADVPADAIHVVVNATDPARANAAVTDYLNYNRIAYENVLPEPGEQALRQQDYQQYNVGKSMAQSMAEPIPQQQQGAQQPAAEAAAREDLRAARQSAPGAAPAPGSAGFAAVEGNQVVVPQRQQQLLARGLKRSQVVSLKSAVAKGTADAAQVIEQAWMADGKQMAADRADAIRPGDEVEITVNELVGAGVEKSNKARVNADGTVNMPMVEPIPAAGQTPEELSQTIARRYREASLIERPTVSVELAKKADTAADGEKLQTGSREATTAPTTGPTTATAAAGPTTAPVAVADPDAPVDVLITVNAIVAPTPPVLPAATLPAATPTTLPVTTAPSTMPATQPVTTAPTTAPVP